MNLVMNRNGIYTCNATATQDCQIKQPGSCTGIFSFILKYACCFQLLIAYGKADAQRNEEAIDSIVAHMYWYAAAKPSSALFVHFDKTVYSNFENVWLRAYLLNSDVPLGSINTLSVLLVKNNSRTIWAESRFIMHNGLASGNMFLPDSLPPGNFSFVAYTNHIINGYPDDIFIQPVTIKTVESDITLSLTLSDTADTKKDFFRVKLKAYTQNFKAFKDAVFTYTVGSNGAVHHAITNKQGEYVFNLPAGQILPGNNTFHVEMRSGVLFKDATITLPVHEEPAEVKFYPEGGNLVDSASTVVGWEVKNDKGEPLQVSGFLYENQHVIDTIITNADGMGRFIMTPQEGNIYAVKLLYTPSKDTEYVLPEVTKAMPAFTVLNSIAEDTLNIILRNINSLNGNEYLLLHDYKNLFAAYSIRKEQSSQFIKIPLNHVPKGIFAITLLDEKRRPFAERLCFAHYNDRDTIEINSDSSEYDTRQKVNVKIRLTDKDGKPVDGIVSVACVQANRAEARKMRDIESYTYLRYQLADLPAIHNSFSSPAINNNFLQNILLIKGWRRYTWTDMMHSSASDTLLTQDKMDFKGSVTRNRKALKKPVELSIYTDSTLRMISSDSSGKFKLEMKDLISKPDSKIFLFINKQSQANYNIHVADPYYEMNKKLANTLQFDNYDIGLTGKNSNNFVLKQGEYAHILQTVIVKSNNNGSFYGHFPAYIGKCADYVCKNGILNCPNHKNDPLNTKPVNDHPYMAQSGGIVIYKGNCAVPADDTSKSIYAVDGIYTAKEFYVPDYSQPESDAQQYLSTIYWNPSLLLSGNKASSVSFYTSDITGRFRIVVQGRTNDDVIYGEYFFNVKDR